MCTRLYEFLLHNWFLLFLVIVSEFRFFKSSSMHNWTCTWLYGSGTCICTCTWYTSTCTCTCTCTCCTWPISARSGWPPSNFGLIVISPETRMMGLPYGEKIMIVGRTVWTQSTSVTDRRTDRITITKTVQCSASHGKNEICIAFSMYIVNTKIETRCAKNEFSWILCFVCHIRHGMRKTENGPYVRTISSCFSFRPVSGKRTRKLSKADILAR